MLCFTNEKYNKQNKINLEIFYFNIIYTLSSKNKIFIHMKHMACIHPLDGCCLFLLVFKGYQLHKINLWKSTFTQRIINLHFLSF